MSNTVCRCSFVVVQTYDSIFGTMKKYYRCCCISWWSFITGLLLVDPARAGGKPEVKFGLNIRSIESMKSDLLESLIPGAKWSQDGTFATCAYNVSKLML